MSALIDHRGRTPKKLGGDFTPSGIPVVSARNIKDGRLVMDGDIRFVTPEMYDKWMPNKLQANDVLLTSEAPLGEAAFLRDGGNYCLGQRLFVLRADSSKVHPRFLYYLLQSPNARHAIEARATGTTAQGIRQSELVKVEVELPPLTHQEAAAQLLGCLDDKIDLNRRMNKRLEDIARAIFKSWFVDFDPVRAKMEGRDPLGIDADTATAFPERLTVTDLGEIPEGWKAGWLDDLVSISRKAITPFNAPDDLFDHYSIPAFDEGKRPVRQRGEEIRSNKFLIKKGCVLVSRLNPRIPRVWLPDPADDGQSVCSTEFAVALPLPPFTTEFIYGLLSSFGFQEQLATLVTGTSGSHQRVKPADLQKMPVVIPDSPIVHIFTEVVASALMRISGNVAESATLAALRDLLLPKLMSGEVRIRDAEYMTEAAF